MDIDVIYLWKEGTNVCPPASKAFSSVFTGDNGQWSW